MVGQLANEVARCDRGGDLDDRCRCPEGRQSWLRACALRQIDVTMPGKRRQPVGYKHPLSIVLDEIKDIFIGHGLSNRRWPGGGDRTTIISRR